MKISRVLAAAGIAVASLIIANPAQGYDDLRHNNQPGGFYRDGVYAGGTYYSDASYTNGRDPSNGMSVSSGGHSHHHHGSRHHHHHHSHQ